MKWAGTERLKACMLSFIMRNAVTAFCMCHSTFRPVLAINLVNKIVIYLYFIWSCMFSVISCPFLTSCHREAYLMWVLAQPFLYYLCSPAVLLPEQHAENFLPLTGELKNGCS